MGFKTESTVSLFDETFQALVTYSTRNLLHRYIHKVIEGVFIHL